MKEKSFLVTFSYIFHPIFVSIYGVLLYLGIAKTPFFSKQVSILLIHITITTLLLPLSIYFLFRAIGKLHSFTEASISERKTPIFIQMVLLFVLVKYSTVLQYYIPLYYFFVGGLLASILALFCIIIKYKASLHMIAICTLTTFLVSLSVYLQQSLVILISVFIVLIGYVAASRLYLKSHTFDELLVGSCIGIFSQVILWGFYL